jgi:hypothetical protein
VGVAWLALFVALHSLPVTTRDHPKSRLQPEFQIGAQMWLPVKRLTLPEIKTINRSQ